MSTAAATPVTPGGINRSVLLPLAGVLFCGSLGGLVFWLIARWAGTPLPTVFGLATVAVLMFIGAVAGAIGVYVLTASDLNAIRTYIFAVICGLAWQPIIGAAQRLATNAAVTSQTAQIGSKMAQIKAATNTGNTQQISAAVQSTVPSVTQALALSTTVGDSSKKAEILDQSKQAINQLQATSAQAPDATVDGLREITLSASKSGQPNIAIQAIGSLHSIASNAEQSRDPALALKIKQSLNTLVEQSQDSSVQKAARDAAAQIEH